MAETYGFDEFERKMHKLKDDFKKGAIELLETTGDEATAEIQMRTPVDTGTLRRSMTRERVDMMNLSVFVGTSILYAPFVEEGHRVGVSGFVPGVFMIRDGATVAGRSFTQNGVKMMKDITKEFR